MIYIIFANNCPYTYIEKEKYKYYTVQVLFICCNTMMGINCGIFFLMLGLLHYIYQINKLTTTKVDSTYLG